MLFSSQKYCTFACSVKRLSEERDCYAIVLPVIRSLGIRDLRTSLPLICESIDQNTVKNNLQDGFILLWHYQIEMSIP